MSSDFGQYLPDKAFMSSGTAPQRDHKIVRDASEAKGLSKAADRMQAYRSEEQAHNDKRQQTGFQPQGPLAFGQFEVGRGSMPQNCFATRQFQDLSKRLVVYPHSARLLWAPGARRRARADRLGTACSHI